MLSYVLVVIKSPHLTKSYCLFLCWVPRVSFYILRTSINMFHTLQSVLVYKVASPTKCCSTFSRFLGMYATTNHFLHSYDVTRTKLWPYIKNFMFHLLQIFIVIWYYSYILKVLAFKITENEGVKDLCLVRSVAKALDC